MKKFLIICILTLIPFISGISRNMYPGAQINTSDTLKVICAESLNNLMVLIQDEYKLSNIDAVLNVKLIGKDLKTDQPGSGELLLTADPAYGISNKGNWFVTVGRDILVPVISINNPYREALNITGIKLLSFSDILRNAENLRWGDILGTKNTEPVSIYIDKGEFTIDQLLRFTGLNREDLKYLESITSDNAVTQVAANKYAFGFVRLTDIAGSDLQSFIDGLAIVPIDQNGNGSVDHFENYQRSYNDLTRAVWIGKYPRSLYSELRLVSTTIPSDKTSLDFIEWMLTSGQAQITASGFSELVPGELRTSLNHVYASGSDIEVENQTYTNVGKAFIWILGIIVIIFLSGIALIFASKRTPPELKEARIAGILDNNKLTIPGGVLFDKSHTWSYMEKNGMVRVGVTDFLQHLTGKISKIIPRNPGEMVKRGEPMFTIVQDGKKLVLCSPLSGIIKNVNSGLSLKGSIINNSPYMDGWIYEIEPSKWMAENKYYLMGENYREWLSKEIVRLKEFLGSHFFRKGMPVLKPVMQDGGEIVDNLLENMGPDLWEEFQLEFIDKAF